MGELVLLLDRKPVSLNNAYSTQGRRRVLSKEAARFKREVMNACQHSDWRYAGGLLGCSFVIGFSTIIQDLGNSEKLLNDAVAEFFGFDDNRLVEIHLFKQYSPTEFTRYTLWNLEGAIWRPKPLKPSKQRKT